MCMPPAALYFILGYHESGLHSSLKKGMLTVAPKEYSCRPQAPAAFMMEALWTMCVSMPSSCARMSRSVCVVALHNR